MQQTHTSKIEKQTTLKKVFKISTAKYPSIASKSVRSNRGGQNPRRDTLLEKSRGDIWTQGQRIRASESYTTTTPTLSGANAHEGIFENFFLGNF